MLKRHKFVDLYEMSSGISTKPEQAGHGSPFVSFSTVFNNYFLPEELPDRMNTSAKEQVTYSVRKGDIFLTRTSETIDELGMSCVALKDYPCATYSGFSKRLRPRQQGVVDERFMGFYLRSALFRKTMTNNAVMTLRASLNEEIFSYLELLLPDFKTQQRIGALLHKLQTKIALNTRIIAELEAMAKLLYDYWFVQFDFPDAKGRPYKSSGGAMVYNAELKREVPEGWELKPIGDLVDCLDNERVPLEKSVRAKRPGDIPYYGATGIFDYIDEHIFEGEYVLIAEDGSIMDDQGWPIVQFITGKAWVNNHAHVLQSKAEGHNEFIFQRLKKIPVVTVMTGSIQKKITGGNLLGYRIAYPGDKLVSEYCEAVKPMRATIFNLERQNQELTTLRDWLLPLLMNGQVVVGEAEEKVGLAMAAEGAGKYERKKSR